MRWRRVVSQVGRSVTVWAVSTVTMLVLAGILPDFQLQSPDGDSATRIAMTAALGPDSARDAVKPLAGFRPAT